MPSPLSINANEEGEAMRHTPVLVDQLMHYLRPVAGFRLVDCTLGPGGHAERLLDGSSPDGRLLGIDRDGEAIAESRRRLAGFGDRFVPVQGDFRFIRTILKTHDFLPVDGIVADLGLSAVQLLDPSRGLSFTIDGPLDMRMDRSRGETAAQLLARLEEAELARLIRRHGEEPAARTIARAIVRARRDGPITTTGQLSSIVTRARRLGPRRRIHPATRTFMALRIEVNDELSGLDTFIQEAVGCLRPGGRLVVIAFHSLEDRIVKTAFRSLSAPCTCPPDLPVCGCGRSETVRVLTAKPVRPSAEEQHDNPRSRSAKLRAVERL
jgi:16S rRNA (cytosine1402-N4)-methyltransferase